MIKNTLSALAAVMCLAAPAGAASITNGSFTGSVGNNVLPSGWTAQLFSPDTNDISEVGGGFFSYDTAPGVESSDGGTWVGIAAGFGLETFGQQITDFVVGQSYKLVWEQFNSGATFSANYNGANAFSVLLDNVAVGSGATSILGEGWTKTSVTFTATSISQLLSFQLASNTPSYMNIDGVAFETTVPVPVPGAALMLMTALGGLGAARRWTNGRS